MVLGHPEGDGGREGDEGGGGGGAGSGGASGVGSGPDPGRRRVERLCNRTCFQGDILACSWQQGSCHSRACRRFLRRLRSDLTHLFTKLKERVRCALKRLKNRLLLQTASMEFYRANVLGRRENQKRKCCDTHITVIIRLS